MLPRPLLLPLLLLCGRIASSEAAPDLVVRLDVDVPFVVSGEDSGNEEAALLESRLRASSWGDDARVAYFQSEQQQAAAPWLLVEACVAVASAQRIPRLNGTSTTTLDAAAVVAYAAAHSGGAFAQALAVGAARVADRLEEGRLLVEAVVEIRVRGSAGASAGTDTATLQRRWARDGAAGLGFFLALLSSASASRDGGVELDLQRAPRLEVVEAEEEGARRCAISAAAPVDAAEDTCLLAPERTNISFCSVEGADADDDDDDACRACVPGFAWSDAARACRRCPPNTFSAGYSDRNTTTTATACAACPDGFTTHGAAGQTCCAPCPPGTSTWRTPGVCTPCRAPHQRAEVEGTARCACAAGTAPDYWAAECVPCVRGTYQPLAGGFAPCLACPPRTTTSASNGATACDVCTGGAYYYADATDAAECRDCAAGTYRPDIINDNDTAAACLPCPPGTHAPAPGAAACAPCPAGAHQPAAGGTACLTCAFDHSAPAELRWRTSDDSRTACVCAPGHVLDHLGAVCAPCPPGFHRALPGGRAGDCVGCPQHTTSLRPGASACRDCAAGAYVMFAAEEAGCEACPPGTYQPGINAPACLPCARGAFAEAGWGACALCPAGTFGAAAGAAACTPCQPFSSSSADEEGRTAPCDCLLGWELVAATGLCRACPGGVSTSVNRCVACPPGAFAGDIGEGVTCLPCAAGAFAPVSGLTTCLACPLYTTSDGGAAACRCARGTRVDYATRDCLPCPAGSFFDPLPPRDGGSEGGSGSACAPCPPGTYSAALMSTHCAACPPHTAAAFYGTTACQDCAEMVTPDRSACHCPTGSYNATSVANLSSSSQSSSSHAWSCQPCRTACPSSSAAEYIAVACAHDHDIVCAACAGGDCAPGTFLLANCTATSDRVCWPCAVGCTQGHYVAQPCTPLRNTRCARCAAEADLCPPGSYLAAACSLDADARCAPCPPGTYADAAAAGTGRTACAACPAGTIAAAADATACAACAGYASPQQTECLAACPPGAYPAAPHSCRPCPPGTHSPDGLLCLACLAPACTAAAPASSPAVEVCLS